MFITFHAIDFESWTLRVLKVMARKRKQEFDMKQPLKVILRHSFCSPVRDCLLPYNNVSEVTTENAENAVIDNLTVVWHPLPDKPPRISAYALYFQKTRVIALHFCPW